jgi:hypothetical protein
MVAENTVLFEKAQVEKDLGGGGTLRNINIEGLCRAGKSPKETKGERKKEQRMHSVPRTKGVEGFKSCRVSKCRIVRT